MNAIKIRPNTSKRLRLYKTLNAYYSGEQLDQHEKHVRPHGQQTAEQHHNRIDLHGR